MPSFMNIVEFAKRARLSTATVSRAFHEPDKVRAATRERVMALAASLGYYPSPSGRALVKGRHEVLGLVWPLEVEGPEARFSQRMLAALTRHLVRNDLDLLICPVDRGEVATLEHARRTLLRSRCDAWILLYPRRGDALIEFLRRSGRPVVCLMGEVPECPDWKSVTLDQGAWIEEALKRLHKGGAKRVAFFGCRQGEPDHEARREAFGRIAPKYFGRHCTIPVWPPAAEDLEAELQAGGDAVIGVSDAAALVALEACRRSGLKVPREVQIAGIDDLPEAHQASPALATFRQPLEEMAGCAVEMALGRTNRSRTFKAAFVAGGSLNPP